MVAVSSSGGNVTIGQPLGKIARRPIHMPRQEVDMNSVDKVAKEMFLVGMRVFEKVGRVNGRPWERQQPHSLAAFRALAEYHLSRLKAAERRATSPNKRVAARKPRPKLSKRQLRHT